MKFIAGYPFPETPDEAQAWKPVIRWIALDRRVLCVAKTRIEGGWAAYIGPVPGINHDFEKFHVLHEGTKLPEKVALAIFSQFSGVPYCE